MKKLTVMAACAALLLGGGCFLKANYFHSQFYALLMNVEALTDPETIIFWEGTGSKLIKESELRPMYAESCDSNGNRAASITMWTCEHFDWAPGCKGEWERTELKYY